MSVGDNSLVRFWAVLFFLGWGLPLAAQDDLPAGKGKETLENTCTECHGLDKALTALRSRENWRAIAIAMRSKGATMSDSELETLVDYLFQYFGTVERADTRAAPIKKTNVNKAAARELETSLQLTASESAALVRYRETKGPFKEWRDLTKVAGVDRSKIEAKRDRLTF